MTGQSLPSSFQPSLSQPSSPPPPSTLTPPLVAHPESEPESVSRRRQQQQQQQQPLSPHLEDDLAPLTSIASSSLSRRVSKPRTQSSTPHKPSTPLFFRPSRSSPSFSSPHPSTAEGRSIPVDHSSVASRTTTLRELNNHLSSTTFSSRTPRSRHRPVKLTGAQSSTNSAPIIVRTYSPPPTPSRLASTATSSRRFQFPSLASIGFVVPSSLGASELQRQDNFPANAGAAAAAASVVRRVLPLHLGISSDEPSKHGLLRMTTIRPLNRVDAKSPGMTKLPPIEAFSFKSFISNMDAQNHSGDMNSNIDRIAEICARSRYSLSNQYEVHYTPHGSGENFIVASQEGLQHQPSGLTLNPVPSDDETGTKRQRKRAGKKHNRAVATLETIISSGRSSDEDKFKKKPAADIAAEVCERAMAAATRVTGESSSLTSTNGDSGKAAPTGQAPITRPTMTKRSTSFATVLLDSNRSGSATMDVKSPCSSAALLSDPAQPQASTSHLEIRTEADDAAASDEDGAVSRLKVALLSSTSNPKDESELKSPPGASIFSSIGSWIPWRGIISEPEATTAKGDNDAVRASEAEGRLRHLLQTSETVSSKMKGKAVDRYS